MHNLFQLPSHWLKFKLWHRQQSRTCLQTFQKDKQKQKQKQKSPHYPVWRSFPVDIKQKQGRQPSTCSVPAYENQPATRLPALLLQSSGDDGRRAWTEHSKTEKEIPSRDRPLLALAVHFSFGIGTAHLCTAATAATADYFPDRGRVLRTATRTREQLPPCARRGQRPVILCFGRAKNHTMRPVPRAALPTNAFRSRGTFHPGPHVCFRALNMWPVHGPSASFILSNCNSS